MLSRTFARASVGVLALNLAVIVWGAFVRASKSGAGCGAHWPLCNGEVIVRPRNVAMAIELIHRATSGIALIAVAVMFVWALRKLPRGHLSRTGAIASMVLMLVEAALGAGLVLLRLVDADASLARAVYLAAHLTNTFLLLAALSLTAWGAYGGRAPRVAARPRAATALLAACGCVLALGVTGGITALGDTLFRATSLAAGMAQDADPASHFLIRLRVVHPALALCTALYLVLTVWAARHGSANRRSTDLAWALTVLFVCQLGIGVMNLLLLAPVWTQLVHLLVADLVWVALVLFCASALEPESREVIA